MNRVLRRAPLVEYVFEVRWGTSEGAGLSEEYQLVLGKIHQKVKSHLPFRRRVVEIPGQFYSATPPVRNVVFDQFLSREPAGGILSYPLQQYGPGVATINFDSAAYAREGWTQVRESILDFFSEIQGCLERFDERVDEVLLRSIDLFPVGPERAREFVTKKLRVEIGSSIDRMNHVRDAIALPDYRCRWKLPSSSVSLKVHVAHGQAFARNGIILDMICHAGGDELRKASAAALLDRQHAILGDAFFELLTEECRDELNRD